MWWKNDADFRTIEMYGNLRHFVYRKGFVALWILNMQIKRNS